MIYVMSDIHGRKDRFEDILEQRNLQEDDTLYILGDVIDRNPSGISLLRYIMSKANIKMLLGNHEDMMLEVIKNNHNTYTWYCNGGEITHNRWKKYRIPQREKMLNYLENLPLHEDIAVYGRKYRLLHGKNPSRKRWLTRSNEQLKNEIIWERVNYADSGPEGITVIFGHTPTIHYQNCEPLQIWYGDNLIGIDCGAAYTDGRLACLRLDDMKEFYSRF